MTAITASSEYDDSGGNGFDHGTDNSCLNSQMSHIPTDEHPGGMYGEFNVIGYYSDFSNELLDVNCDVYWKILTVCAVSSPR